MANLHSKGELLEYLRRRQRSGEGYASLGELGDAYPGARADLEVSLSRAPRAPPAPNRWLPVKGGVKSPPLAPACPPRFPSRLSRPLPTALRQALKSEGLLFGLPAADSQRKEVFYPVDQQLQLRVDVDVQVCTAGHAGHAGRTGHAALTCWQQQALLPRPLTPCPSLPCVSSLLIASQELWLSVGDTLPEEDEEMAAELQKIGGC